MFVKNIPSKYKILLLAVFIIIVTGGVLIFGKTKDKEPVIVDALEVEEEKKEKNDNALETFNVDIKGAIKNPGVYKVVNGSIVNDVISYAGGLNDNATTTNINLSKKVADEMVIYIYTKSEYNKKVSKSSSSISSSNNISSNCEASQKTPEITSCLANSTSSIITNTNPNDEINSDNKGLININTASVELLATLPGIGESKAKSIVTYRETNGLFTKIEDIKNISGIGESLFEKIKDSITI